MFSSKSTFLYYESIKQDLKTRPINDCRYDERLKTKVEESTRLVYTGLFGELEHLKIETRYVHYESESRKQELKTRPIYEGRCDERLKSKAEKSTRLAHTRLIEESRVVYY
jgi:hypothetical protein